MYYFFLTDNASELSWESPEENNEFLSPMPEEEEEEEDEDDDAIKKLVSNNILSSNVNRMAPQSTLNGVTLNNVSDFLVRML